MFTLFTEFDGFARDEDDNPVTWLICPNGLYLDQFYTGMVLRFIDGRGPHTVLRYEGKTRRMAISGLAWMGGFAYVSRVRVQP
jgi:hypothetical protein